MSTSSVRHVNHRPATVRMARWSATHPWRAIALWLVFVAACIAAGNIAGQRQLNDLDTVVGQSGRAAHWIHDAHLTGHDTENVLITSRTGRLDAAAATAAARDVRNRMTGLAAISAVAAPMRAHDGSAVAVQITLRDNADIAPLLRASAAAQRHFPNMRVEQVGSRSLNDAVNTQVADDLSAAAGFSLPVTLVILLVAFGAILAAGIPLLLALSAVASATGLSALASHLLPSTGSVSAMILLMGMAVGVDYSLFYVKRARAERHRGASGLDAVEIAAETSGHSVLVSGMAVIVSMLGLYVSGDATFASLATGSILVVTVAVLGSLTVLPAVLVKLGRSIDRPRVPLLWRWTMQDREPRLWPALLRPSLERPGRALTVSVLLLAALAVPALGMRLASDSVSSLPDSIAEKNTMERLTAAFPGESASASVVVRAPSAAAAEVTARLSGLAARLGSDPLFVPDSARVRSSADGATHLLSVDAPFDAEAAQARDGVRALRSNYLPSALRGTVGVQWAVGGDAALNLDSDRRAADRLPWVVAFVVVLTMAIMGWVFRSLVIALLTAVVNLLSAGAAFGVQVLVFQHSWAEGLLGFRSTGALISWIPLFTFAVLFGLSMDYHVFVLSRVREAARQGLPMPDAVREGISATAGTVTSAAIVMVSLFSIFASLHMIEMKELGLGLAVAVLVDALVVRVIVLPSLLVLLGRASWWPGRAPASRTALAAELVAVG